MKWFSILRNSEQPLEPSHQRSQEHELASSLKLTKGLLERREELIIPSIASEVAARQLQLNLQLRGGKERWTFKYREGTDPQELEKLWKTLRGASEVAHDVTLSVSATSHKSGYVFGRWLASVSLPSRVSAADTLLIFVAKPDDAEVILGDLLEEMEKVRRRKSTFVTWLWFWWEIFWIMVKQGGARIRENTLIGRFLDACIKRVNR